MDSSPNKLPLWMTEPNSEDIVDDKKVENWNICLALIKHGKRQIL